MKKALVVSLVAIAVAACSNPRAERIEGDKVVAVLKKPTALAKPSTSGGGGGGSTSNSACGHDADQCFGAIGLACDGIIIPSGPIAGCSLDSCAINAGSWDHDQCCFTHPNGHFCGVQNAASGPACTAEWDKAVHRVTHGLSWRRTLDKCVHDTTGVVDFAAYCAVSGTIIASGDGAKCCTKKTRAYDAQRDQAAASAQGLRLDGSFTPVVCDVEPPPPSTNCATDAQCKPGESCLQHVCRGV